MQRPRKARLTLQVTLRSGGQLVQRKVSVLYPKKLYPFELKQEVCGFVHGFKTMVEITRSIGEEKLRVRPPRVSQSRASFRRRRVNGKPIAISATSKLKR